MGSRDKMLLWSYEKPIQTIKERLKDEIQPFSHGPKRVAMLYPSPYRAGMSSLGYQWTIQIYPMLVFSVERVLSR